MLLFQVKHKKNYSAKEEAARKANFRKMDKEIELHNGNPDSTYTKAHNYMSDWVTQRNILWLSYLSNIHVELLFFFKEQPRETEIFGS